LKDRATQRTTLPTDHLTTTTARQQDGLLADRFVQVAARPTQLGGHQV
jgi:hypothetical protein